MDRSAALDEAKLSAFEERLAATLNAGALCLMTSIGHRTGLFDAMAEMAPGTSAQIAAGASLNERYVREWLGAMVAAGVVGQVRDLLGILVVGVDFGRGVSRPTEVV